MRPTRPWSNDRDATGYKAYRDGHPLPLVDDPKQLWVGERVRLLPMPEDDVGEEFGVVEEYQAESGMFTVTVEDEFLEDEDDDGLREVPTDQAELAPPKRPR